MHPHNFSQTAQITHVSSFRKYFQRGWGNGLNVTLNSAKCKCILGGWAILIQVTYLFKKLSINYHEDSTIN